MCMYGTTLVVETTGPNNKSTGWNKNKNMNTKPQYNNLRQRWIVLALCCTVLTTLYYSFDIATVLHQQLRDYMSSSSSNTSNNESFEFRYNLLFVSYSLPNIILPLIGGKLVDKIGSSKCLILFSTLCFCGHVIFTLGVQLKSWCIVYLGRIVYGLGGESLFVAQSTILARWFSSNSNIISNNNETAFAFGISSSISWFGGILNDWITPPLANFTSILTAMWFGAVMLLLGVLSSVLVWYIECNVASSHCGLDVDAVVDSIHDFDGLDEKHCYVDGVDINLTHSNSEEGIEFNQGVSEAYVFNIEHESNLTKWIKIPKFTTLFWTISICYLLVEGSILMFDNIASGILMERSYFVMYSDEASTCHLPLVDQCTSGTLQQIGINDFTLNYENGYLCHENDDPNVAPTLPTSINITTLTMENDTESSFSSWWKSNYTYNPLYPKHINCDDPFWSKACTQNYCNAQNHATEVAGRAMSIPYIFSAITVPILGYISDRIGCLGIYLALAPIILLPVHFTLAFGTSSPIFPLIGQGVACALYTAAIWPSIPRSVPKDQIGMAFGVITALLNFVLVLFPLITTYLYKVSGNTYIPHVEVFFFICAIMGSCAGIRLNFLNDSCLLNRKLSSDGNNNGSRVVCNGEMFQEIREVDHDLVRRNVLL